jgi:hypothetical protein
VVCRRDYTGLFVALKNEELRTNATLRLPLASARSGIVDVAANRHPICNSLLRLCGNVCRRRQGRVHPRPTEARKRFSLASARAAHPILCMKPIPFLARALAGSGVGGAALYIILGAGHPRRAPESRRLSALQFLSSASAVRYSLHFRLDVPGLADVGESSRLSFICSPPPSVLRQRDQQAGHSALVRLSLITSQGLSARVSCLVSWA